MSIEQCPCMKKNGEFPIWLGVVGTPKFHNKREFERELDKWVARHGPIVDLITDSRDGTAAMARAYALERDVKLTVMASTPDLREGQSDFARNRRIANASTHLLAFTAGRDKDTRDIVRQSKTAKVKVEIVQLAASVRPGTDKERK